MRGIRKQGKDSYRITVSLGKDYNSDKYKKYQETFKGRKRDAEKRKAELISQFSKGININPEKISYGEYLDKWLNDYGRSNLSQRTLYDYTYIIKYHVKPELGHIPLSKLCPSHLRDFYALLLKEGRKDKKKNASKGLSPAYVKKIHVIIHESLKHAMKWELVYKNVADAVDPPKVAREEVTPLSEKDIEKLIKELKGSYLYIPTCLAVGTGMRAGEVLGLTWKDVDLKTGVITVRQAQKIKRSGYEDKITYEITFGLPKSKNSRRSINIPGSLVKLLKRHKVQQKKAKLQYGELYEDNDLVCCCWEGSPINNNTFSSDFRKAARKAGFHISFHNLRHSHASLLVKMNENLKTISARLGHSGIGITADTYAHLAPDGQVEAARKIGEILPFIK